MLKNYFFIFVLSFSAFARPDNLEVWFLSSPSVTENKVTIPLEAQHQLAESKSDKCRSINEKQCFHPQFGMISKKDGKKVDFEDKQKTQTTDSIKLSESDLLRCKNTYHFDLFCGETAKIKRKTKNLEIWIDTSSSMRSYDYVQEKNTCYRKTFMTLLRSGCKKAKFDISSFADSIKSIVNDDYLCSSKGVNNQDRLISWMEASLARNLIVITDASQLTLKMTTYLESKGAKIRGMNKSDTIYANKLKELVPKAASFCK